MEAAYIVDTGINSIEVWVNELIIIETTQEGFNDRVDRAKVIMNTSQNLQLIQALETAQKELDPGYKTREELQAEIDALTEEMGRANQ